jgi:ribonuclease D
MTAKKTNYQLINTPRELDQFAAATRDLEWMSFDTEFIGERRYYTLLCLIQICTDHGTFLLDPLALEHIDPFLRLIENPRILKITHAGDNDYRLLYNNYGTVPQNIFDTQVAAGFAGYRYPLAFSKLVGSELNIKLKKGYAVTDWEKRPFAPKQLRYALDDVLPLRKLYLSLREKLEAKERMHWAEEECALMTSKDYYDRHPHHEALTSNLVKAVRPKEQLFLVRLLEWRRNLAERKNYSKEMILPNKMISHIMRAVKSGPDALEQNRRLPNKTVKKYGDFFLELYKRPITEEEQQVLDQIPVEPRESEDDQALSELLYLILKYRAQEEDISPAMVTSRNSIKRMRYDETFREEFLSSNWRRELLGKDFIGWLQQFDRLKVRISGGKIELVPQ